MGGRCEFETGWKGCVGNGIDCRDRVCDSSVARNRGCACLREWTHAKARGCGDGGNPIHTVTAKVDGIAADFSGSVGAEVVIAKLSAVDVLVNNVGIFDEMSTVWRRHEPLRQLGYAGRATFGGSVVEVHRCPVCGSGASRDAK